MAIEGFLKDEDRGGGAKIVMETSMASAWMYFIEGEWHVARHNPLFSEEVPELATFGNDVESALEKLREWAWERLPTQHILTSIEIATVKANMAAI